MLCNSVEIKRIQAGKKLVPTDVIIKRIAWPNGESLDEQYQYVIDIFAVIGRESQRVLLGG